MAVYFYLMPTTPYQAVKMTSVRTQLPYEYYTLPFCRPGDEDAKLQYKSLNLGMDLLHSFGSVHYVWFGVMILFWLAFLDVIEVLDLFRK